MKQPPSVILAIESAIGGGSLSLLRDGVEVTNWIGSDNVSKAEDLLFNIDAILTAENISRHEIDLIAVSAGPGSFTGIRIGIATALGLKTALGIEMLKVSALEAMVGPSAQNVTPAVPMGRNAVCYQNFTTASRSIKGSEPAICSETDFAELTKSEVNRHFILHSLLYEKCGRSSNTTDFGMNIARSVGIAGVQNRNKQNLEPIFISKNF